MSGNERDLVNMQLKADLERCLHLSPDISCRALLKCILLTYSSVEDDIETIRDSEAGLWKSSQPHIGKVPDVGKIW